MSLAWRPLMLRVLRVPPAPAPPPGAGVVVFRAGRNFLRYRIATWGMAQAGAALGLVASMLFFSNIALPPFTRRIFEFLEVMGWAGFVAQLPFSLAVAVVDWEMRWYMVTDRSLRIREGVLTVRERTMTFANIQDISLRQGPLERLLGISNVEVRSAGGGGGSGSDVEEAAGEAVHVGRFRGVEDAAGIRDRLLEGVRLHRHAGLGDPEEANDALAPRPAVDAAALVALVTASRRLAEEAAALRKAMERRQMPNGAIEPA